MERGESLNMDPWIKTDMDKHQSTMYFIIPIYKTSLFTYKYKYVTLYKI